MKMSHQEPVYGNFRFRILTPMLAATLPDPPAWLFDAARPLSGEWIDKIKFGFINFIFLSATGALFFYYLSSLGFLPLESLIGVLLFYSARPVLQSSGIPMVDASAVFFLLLGMWAIVRQAPLLLCVSFAAGIFAKETLLLIVPALLFSQMKGKVKTLFFLSPVIIFYFFFRFLSYGNINDLYFNFNVIALLDCFMSRVSRVSMLIDTFSSFGFLWLFMLYALFSGKAPLLLRRWLWLLAVIFLFSGGYGRILFLAFPVIIPLSLLGIRHLFVPFSSGAETARVREHNN
jgi:hypothetical protein